MIDLNLLKLLYNLLKNISFSDLTPILKSGKSKKLRSKTIVLKSGELMINSIALEKAWFARTVHLRMEKKEQPESIMKINFYIS